MDLTPKDIKKLIRRAVQTRKFAFVPRSNHKVGASVLTRGGKIFGGCNVESVISGLGTCAERHAIDHAIAHGEYTISAMCTVDEGMTPTCGSCLQYALLFSQLSGKDIIIVNADMHGHYEVTQLSILLPHGYRTAQNLRRIRSYNGKTKKK